MVQSQEGRKDFCDERTHFSAQREGAISSLRLTHQYLRLERRDHAHQPMKVSERLSRLNEGH
jgi:hypothetical protein